MLLDDFFTEYWPREETLEEVWGWVLGRTQGHLHLSGPAGCGKSWLVRGLAVGAQERGALPLYLETAPEESFSSVIWRLVDAAEFMLDIDGEGLRLAVSQAFYEGNAAQALLAAMHWLTQEIEGSFLFLLDGYNEASELARLPHWRDFPEGVYLVTAGQVLSSVDQLVINPLHVRNLDELQGYVSRRLAEERSGVAAKIVELSQGNWRAAYYYTVLDRMGQVDLPLANEIFDRLFECLSGKLGAELFRNVHLEVLLLLAVAQVPASLDLLKSWELPSENIAFALFELRDLLTTDGEGSQYDALFTGEHYSLRSPDLRAYLLERAAWRDRISDAHRRAVAKATSRRPSPVAGTGPSDADFYAHCFAQYHLRESGRIGDLQRLMQDPETVERCWNLARSAREHGYEEISLQLFLVAAQILESRKTPSSRRHLAQMAELYADCCHALTNQGRYSDGASFGEQALELVRPLSTEEVTDPVEGLLTHCLLCLADPYLYMGYVQRAYPLYAEACERSGKEVMAEPAKTIHAMRGMARSARALGNTSESLHHGQEAIELARKLTRDEGEEWAQYLFDLLMEQSETLRAERETIAENPSPLDQMGIRWESLRLLREAEEQYHKFQWNGDQELVFLYLEQSMVLFDLEKWGEAEERLSKAIEVLNALPAGDSHPADVASLEFLRSHALALMNRIGEASGSLANLLTPELMQEMDISEQALVLFFRGKILSHQGLLRSAEATLQDSIMAYQQAIGVGADDLILEQVSARIYLARVQGRRGRLEEALELTQDCRQQLLELSQEEGPPALELADASELEGWILVQQGRYREALEACGRASEGLDHIWERDAEADVETEQSLSLLTRAAALSGLGQHEEAIRLGEQAVEIEKRRAQEGYEQARMWQAIHRLALAKLFRQGNLPEKALRVASDGWSDLDSLPVNQKNHLGLHMAALHLEIALANIQLQQWSQVRLPLEQACSIYENEMWQSKEYLIAVLLDCHRHWLDFCRQAANQDWQDRSCWKQFFEGWNRWQAHMHEEVDNVFLHQSQARLREWTLSLPLSVQQEWNAMAPQGLRVESAA